MYDFSVDYNATSKSDILNIQLFDEQEWYSINTMFRFIGKMLIAALMFVSCGALTSLLMSNQESRVRPAIMKISSNEPVFYSYSVLVSKCCGSCNIISLHAKLCVPEAVKNMNIKVFNLMSRTNGKRHTLSYETSACKCRLDANVCNDKKR